MPPLPTPPLPPPRTLLTHLLTSTSPPPTSKSLFLTLHTLYPNDLLPALDLLDRKLVTRLVVNDSAAEPQFERDTGAELGTGPVAVEAGEEGGLRDVTGEGDGGRRERRKERVVYYVRSARAGRGGRERGERNQRREREKEVGYEVRLTAWHCTCAAFAFGCFGEGGGGLERAREGEKKREKGWFGGLTRASGGKVPVCKHLLACALVEGWGDRGEGMVEERRVGKEEAGGWGVGVGLGWGGC